MGNGERRGECAQQTERTLRRTKDSNAVRRAWWVHVTRRENSEAVARGAVSVRNKKRGL